MGHDRRGRRSTRLRSGFGRRGANKSDFVTDQTAAEEQQREPAPHNSCSRFTRLFRELLRKRNALRRLRLFAHQLRWNFWRRETRHTSRQDLIDILNARRHVAVGAIALRRRLLRNLIDAANFGQRSPRFFQCGFEKLGGLTHHRRLLLLVAEHRRFRWNREGARFHRRRRGRRARTRVLRETFRDRTYRRRWLRRWARRSRRKRGRRLRRSFHRRRRLAHPDAEHGRLALKLRLVRWATRTIVLT